jgi:HxlR-like helix-turn-helix
MGVSKKEISPCPIDVTLSVIDGRWKGTMLWRLLDGPMRTNELRKSIPEITERMLLRDSGTSSGARLAPASAVLANAVRTDVGPGIGCSLFVGQRTFETRCLYLILAEMLFTLPAANEMLPLSALFAGKYREVGIAAGVQSTASEGLSDDAAFYQD